MTKFREWIVIPALAILWACGSAEQATVDQFFRATQSDDSTTVASMSAVGSPVEVESWRVVEVSSRSTQPYTLPELLEQFEGVKKDRDVAVEAATKYGKEHVDALEEIIPKLRADPEYKYQGRLAPIQEEWTKLIEDRREKELAYQELRRKVNHENNLAAKSVMRQLDVGKLRGAIAVTEMLLNLKPKDGAELPFKVTLHKYDLSEPESERTEPARWIIAKIEGATPEAQAAAAAAAKPTIGSEPPSGEAAATPEATPVAADASEATAKAEPSRRDSGYVPRELRGLARIQILNPETKVEGAEVVTTIRARNVSRDWITGFMVTEHWYDQQGNAVNSNSQTHRTRFMPGEVVEIQLRTRKGANFYQSQYQFSHANGEVNATTVGSFPKETG